MTLPTGRPLRLRDAVLVLQHDLEDITQLIEQRLGLLLSSPGRSEERLVDHCRRHDLLRPPGRILLPSRGRCMSMERARRFHFEEGRRPRS
jgi:hypothetical protein